KYGLRSLRPNEQQDGGDRYAGGTFAAKGDTRNWTSPPLLHSRQRVSQTDDKRLAIYVPCTAFVGRNNVHVFFTPDTVNPMSFLNQQGLRAEEESSGWILIAVPGLDEDASPNWVTISTAEIETCFMAAGRSSVAIDAIRLSAHSRGARGLEHTL